MRTCKFHLFILFILLSKSSCNISETNSKKVKENPTLIGVWKIIGFDYTLDPSYGLMDLGKFYIFNDNDFNFTINPNQAEIAYPCSYDWKKNQVLVKSNFGDYTMTFEIKDEELFLTFDLTGVPFTYHMKRATEQDLKNVINVEMSKKNIAYNTDNFIDVLSNGKRCYGKVKVKDLFYILYDDYHKEYNKALNQERLIFTKGI
jgi:hypothetical protein